MQRPCRAELWAGVTSASSRNATKRESLDRSRARGRTRPGRGTPVAACPRIRLDRWGTTVDTATTWMPMPETDSQDRVAPHESRKTSQAVVCRISFVNKCFAPRSRAAHGRGRTSSSRRPACEGAIAMAIERTPAATIAAREGALLEARLLEHSGRPRIHLVRAAERSAGLCFRGTINPQQSAIAWAPARSGAGEKASG
jgi:hypothetical protein